MGMRLFFLRMRRAGRSRDDVVMRGEAVGKWYGTAKESEKECIPWI
jgi:hypothetical protein